MLYSSSLFSPLRGSMKHLRMYPRSGKTIVRGHPAGSRPVSQEMSTTGAWVKAMCPLVRAAVPPFWGNYLSSISSFSSYLSQFTAANYSLMYPSTDQQSALFCWGNVSPLVMSQQVIEPGLIWTTVIPNSLYPEDMFDVCDIYNTTGFGTPFVYLGTVPMRQYFPWTFAWGYPSPGWLLIFTISRYNQQSGVLEAVGNSLNIPVY